MKRLIPDAEITGVDINPWCIKTASLKNKYPDCNFQHYLDKDWEKSEYYDCILALAVFQKTIHRQLETVATRKTFTFSIFEKRILSLVKLLKIDGLFVLDRSDYQFSDLAMYKNTFVPELYSEIIRRRPTYDKSNKKITQVSASNRIFRKIRKTNETYC